MDINLLLQGVDCKCGKKHTCPIKYVYVEDGAISRLNEVLKDFNKILLVADQNTFDAAGDKVKKEISLKIKKQVIFSGKTVLIPNEESIDTVVKNCSDIDFILGVGSGVIQDLCKYVSFDQKIPYAIVATAPSMDGYASSGAAMITGGMKVTYTVGLPYAIIADTDVLFNAPKEMIKAGYGDVVGKYSSLNDWKLSALINGEYFCEYIYQATMDMVKKTVSVAEGLLKGDKQSIKALTEALIVVGILISFAGSSRPASGSEHHLSHFFEIVGIVTNTPYLAHGTDVAYSTIITAKIREDLVNTKFPSEIYCPTDKQLKEELSSVYYSVAEGCYNLQKKLGTYEKQLAGVYLEKEEEIKAILREMPSAKEIERLLSLVGLDIKEYYQLYGNEKIERAVKYAKDLKDRYTVLWLNYHVKGGKY